MKKVIDVSIKVGISMPDKTLQRWYVDGVNMMWKLKDAGYEVELVYADNKVATQIAQIEALVSNGANVLVITNIDAAGLAPTLDGVKSAGVEVVIAYDRLIVGTHAVDYYVTFDNEKVGELQGGYIRDKLDLDNRDGTFNIELFTGPSKDINVDLLFTYGAMKVLQPYIGSGKLVVKSGQVTKEQCSTDDWDTDKALERMEHLVSRCGYSPDDDRAVRLDAVLCSNDSVALGVSDALENAGYTSDNFPVITGQDAEISNVMLINSGRQSMTVFKDTRKSGAIVVGLIKDIASGNVVITGDTVTCDNGKKIVPTYLCAPTVVCRENIGSVLIESGYYEKDQIG